MNHASIDIRCRSVGRAGSLGPGSCSRRGWRRRSRACTNECARWRSDQRARCGITRAVWMLQRNAQCVLPGLSSPTTPISCAATGPKALALHKAGDEVVIFTRNGHDHTGRFPVIRDSLLSLPARSAIIDAEIVVCDSDGKPDFSALMDGLAGSRSRRQRGVRRTAIASNYSRGAESGLSSVAHHFRLRPLCHCLARTRGQRRHLPNPS